MNGSRSWKTFPLSEVVDILDSKRVPVNSKERAKREGDIPYYGATGQVGTIDTYLFDEELVLLGEDGAPFLDPTKPKAYMIRGKSWVNNHAHVLRGKSGLLNAFLLYQLNAIDYRPYVSGTTRLKLPQGPMKQIPLLVPSEKEQKRIVAEIEKQFTRLDAGVAALRRVHANLKRYRAAVLKSACEGKLVPTEAELAKAKGRKYETGEQLLKRILTERRKNWSGRGKYKEPAAPDTTNLPELPEGWAWISLDQSCSKITDGEHLSPTTTDEGVCLLSAKDVREQGVLFDDPKFVSAGDAEQFRKRCDPERGDVLIVSRGATIGRICVVQTDAVFCLMGSVILLKPCLPISGKYLSLCLAENRAKVTLGLLSGSTAQQAIYIRDIRPFSIPLPPLAEQTRIVEEVERRLSMVEELESLVETNLQRATKLRQSILQKAFEGEL